MNCKDHYDVVVAGGGPAGVTAALAAARNGAETLLVERCGSLGGLSTNGLVPMIAPLSWHKTDTLVCGIGGEIAAAMRQAEPGVEGIWTWINPEPLKVIYDRLMQRAGVVPLFFTTVTGVESEDGCIRAVKAQCKTKRMRFTANLFVDCTGDADVAHLAGCPTVQGDSEGHTQAVSLCFVLCGADVDRLPDEPILTAMRRQLKSALASGELAHTDDYQYHISGVWLKKESGALFFNFGHVYGVDGTDPADMTRVMTVGREHAQRFADYLRRHMTGMEGVMVAQTGAIPGVRETRRIRGDYVLEKDAFFNSERHKDDIACYDYPPDVHASTPAAADNGENPFARLRETAKTACYGIPYRALLPRGVNNLAVAGRCISADRPMQGTSRCMPGAFATGEAAGTAAALGVQQKCAFAEVDVDALRERLRSQNAIV